MIGRFQVFIALLFMCGPVFGEAIPIIGTIRTPDGTPFNGRIRFTLSSAAARDIRNNNLTVPQRIEFPVVNGTLPKDARIIPNDSLEPSNTYYMAQYSTGSGVVIAQTLFYIHGPSFDISSAVPSELTTNSLTGMTNLSTKQLNAIRFCDQFPGATAGEKWTACMQDLPSSGGIADATGIIEMQAIVNCPFDGIKKPVTIKLAGAAYRVDASCTIPDNVTMDFSEGASLVISPDVTVVANGGIRAPLTQIFAGMGVISISSIKTPVVYPQWWGAACDASTDDVISIARAVSSLTSGGTLEIHGRCKISDSVTITASNIAISGSGQDLNAAIHFDAMSSKPIFKIEGGSVRIGGNLTLRGNGAAAGGGMDATNTGVLVTRPLDKSFADFDLYIDPRVTFSRLAVGIDYRGRNLRVDGAVFTHVKDGILCAGADTPDGGNRGCVVMNTRFHSMGYPHTGKAPSRAIVLPASTQNFFEVQIQNNYADDIEQFVVGNARSGQIVGNQIVRHSTNVAVIDVDTTANEGAAQGWVISGNILSSAAGSGMSWPFQHGIKVGGSFYVISSNSLVRMGGHAVLVAATNATIANNIIINPSYGTTGVAAVAAIKLTGANNLVTNNYCLRDDIRNSGMTYCVDPGENVTYVGPHVSLNAVIDEINVDSANSIPISQPSMRIDTNLAGTYGIFVGNNGANNFLIRDDGMLLWNKDVALWPSTRNSLAIRDASDGTDRISFNAKTGDVIGVNWTSLGAGAVKLGSTTFSALGNLENGAMVYCADCMRTDPCASGGTGAIAFRIARGWVCGP